MNNTDKQKPDFSRRNLLSLAGAAAAATMMPKALSGASEHLSAVAPSCAADCGQTLWAVANSIRADTKGFNNAHGDRRKWGNGIDLYQACHGKIVIRGRTEEDDTSTTNQAASLPFYTLLRINSAPAYPESEYPLFFGGNQPAELLWRRRAGEKSTDCDKLVPSPSDPDFIRLYSRFHPDFALNNLEKSTEGVEALVESDLATAADAKIPNDSLFALSAGSLTTYDDMEQMSRWLRSQSDPWSVATWREINLGSNGHGLYSGGVYHVFPNLDMQRVLTVTFDYGSGLLRRIDSKSDLSGNFPAKVYAGLPGPDGRVIPYAKYGVGNMPWDAAESNLYVPELEEAYKMNCCPK